MGMGMGEEFVFVVFFAQLDFCFGISLAKIVPSIHGILGIPWKITWKIPWKIHGIPLNSMEFSMKLHGIFHKHLTYFFIIFSNGIPWNSMEFHRIQ
jgi:hypothetical protein